MTETKRQLRAEAVERLRNLECHSIGAQLQAILGYEDWNHDWDEVERDAIALLSDDEPTEGDAVALLRDWLDYKINRFDAEANAIILNTGADPDKLYEIVDMIERDYVPRENYRNMCRLIGEAHRERDELKRENDDLRELHAQVMSERNHALAERDELKVKYGRAESNCRALNAQLGMVRTSERGLRAERDELKRELDKADEAVAARKSLNEYMQANLEEWHRKYDELKSKLEERERIDREAVEACEGCKLVDEWKVSFLEAVNLADEYKAKAEQVEREARRRFGDEIWQKLNAEGQGKGRTGQNNLDWLLSDHHSALFDALDCGNCSYSYNDGLYCKFDNPESNYDVCEAGIREWLLSEHGDEPCNETYMVAGADTQNPSSHEADSGNHVTFDARKVTCPDGNGAVYQSEFTNCGHPYREGDAVLGADDGKMTLDEAIAHAEDVAQSGGKCAAEHAQLAEWLSELRDANLGSDRGTSESETSMVAEVGESYGQYPEQGERGFTGDCESDTREKLEADVRAMEEWRSDGLYIETDGDEIIELLDRQAAITTRELIENARSDCDICGNDFRRQRDEMRDENTELQAKVGELSEQLEAAHAKNRSLKVHIAKMQDGRHGWHIEAKKLQEQVDCQNMRIMEAIDVLRGERADDGLA